MSEPRSHLHQRNGFRLTFVTNNVRGCVEEYDTESLRDALHQFVDAGFGDGPESGGPEKWIFAVVIERGEARYEDRQAVAEELRDLAMVEQARATR